MDKKYLSTDFLKHTNLYFVVLDVFTTVKIQIVVFWVMTSRGYKLIGGIYCLHLRFFHPDDGGSETLGSNY
jgi:hypothetical protein